LRRAAVALMPARWDEPGPLAAIEAMGAGTPIVAFDRGGLAEYVRRSGGGVVVPSTPDALASACAELLRDDEQWHELSARGAAAAASEHSPATYLSRLTAAYELAREITTTGD